MDKVQKQEVGQVEEMDIRGGETAVSFPSFSQSIPAWQTMADQIGGLDVRAQQAKVLQQKVGNGQYGLLNRFIAQAPTHSEALPIQLMKRQRDDDPDPIEQALLGTAAYQAMGAQNKAKALIAAHRLNDEAFQRVIQNHGAGTKQRLSYALRYYHLYSQRGIGLQYVDDVLAYQSGVEAIQLLHGALEGQHHLNQAVVGQAQAPVDQLIAALVGLVTQGDRDDVRPGRIHTLGPATYTLRQCPTLLRAIVALNFFSFQKIVIAQKAAATQNKQVAETIVGANLSFAMLTDCLELLEHADVAADVARYVCAHQFAIGNQATARARVAMFLNGKAALLWQVANCVVQQVADHGEWLTCYNFALNLGNGAAPNLDVTTFAQAHSRLDALLVADGNRQNATAGLATSNMTLADAQAFLTDGVARNQNGWNIRSGTTNSATVHIASSEQNARQWAAERWQQQHNAANSCIFTGVNGMVPNLLILLNHFKVRISALANNSESALMRWVVPGGRMYFSVGGNEAEERDWTELEIIVCRDQAGRLWLKHCQPN